MTHSQLKKLETCHAKLTKLFFEVDGPCEKRALNAVLSRIEELHEVHKGATTA